MSGDLNYKLTIMEETKTPKGADFYFDEITDCNITSYAVVFNVPDGNGNIITPESVNTKDLDDMKSWGKIIDYVVNEIGVKVTISETQLLNMQL